MKLYRGRCAHCGLEVLLSFVRKIPGPLSKSPSMSGEALEKLHGSVKRQHRCLRCKQIKMSLTAVGQIPSPKSVQP
jgi:hypothetical protein